MMLVVVSGLITNSTEHSADLSKGSYKSQASNWCC